MIGFLGLSHLGLVSAAGAAAKGFDVVGFDEDSALLDRLRRGELPVVEPGLADLLADVSGRMTLTGDARQLAKCDLLYVAVDVPRAPDDSSDCEPVERLLRLAAEEAGDGACVVVLSQVKPGFTRALRPMVERTGAVLCYQVETLIFGRAVERVLEPERHIIGLADPAAPIPTALREYLEAYSCPLVAMRYESAELCKVAINALLVSTISTTNMLAELCETIGADWGEIAPALRSDRRIGPYAYLAPGLGIGGPNLTRDLATIDNLARERGSDSSVIRAWRAHGTHRAQWPLAILHEQILGQVEQPRIAIWGLSYKENTQSTRNSAGVELARTLAMAGIDVIAYDPQAEPVSIECSSFQRVDRAEEACERADALVIATPWRAFASARPEAIANALRGRLIVDPYDLLDERACAAAGLARARLGTEFRTPARC